MTKMKLKFRPIQKADGEAILTWRYDPPYDIYNIGYEGFSNEEELNYFLDPQFAFHAIDDMESGELVGFCSFGLDGQVPGGDYEEPALDIGLGVRPDLTGKGLGSGIVTAVISFAQQTYAPARIRVTIADFNTRAKRVWKKNGLRPFKLFYSENSGMPFTIFTRKMTV